MSDKYTPEEGVLKRAYAEGISVNSCDAQDDCDLCAEAHAQVDRFIAKVRADALRTEADRIERAATNITHIAVTEHVMVSNGAPGLLRESADRIERDER